jgi:hypothetical protein
MLHAPAALTLKESDSAVLTGEEDGRTGLTIGYGRYNKENLSLSRIERRSSSPQSITLLTELSIPYRHLWTSTECFSLKPCIRTYEHDYNLITKEIHAIPTVIMIL